MLVCTGASVCACVRVYALRIVSMDKILHFTNTFIIIMICVSICVHVLACVHALCVLVYACVTLGARQSDLKHTEQDVNMQHVCVSVCLCHWEQGSLI